jgi:hypothetical protein
MEPIMKDELHLTTISHFCAFILEYFHISSILEK